MQNIGQISHLFISKKDKVARISKKELEVEIQGIIGDKFYDKDLQRSVLITSLESYTLTLKHGVTLPYGSLGENLLVNFNPYILSEGTQLHIGTSILEISQNCTICEHLSSIDARLPTLLKNDRGIFAKVVKEGVMSVEDSIYFKV